MDQYIQASHFDTTETPFDKDIPIAMLFYQELIWDREGKHVLLAA